MQISGLEPYMSVTVKDISFCQKFVKENYNFNTEEGLGATGGTAVKSGCSITCNPPCPPLLQLLSQEEPSLM